MRDAKGRSTAAKFSSLKTIEGLLDYAILESAELELPLVVYLLCMARLELETAFVSSSSVGNATEISLQ